MRGLTIPLMNIAHSWVSCVFAIAPRASRVIDGGRVLFLHPFWQQMLIYIPRRKGRLSPRLRVGVVLIILKHISLLDLIVLVVSCPDYQRWVRSQPPNVLSYFILNGLKEGWVNWVAGADEGKVMPDQDAQHIACFHEGIVLIDTTAPYANHYLIGLHHEFHPVEIAILGYLGKITVGGDPARPTSKDINTVDAEVERLAELVFFLH